MKRVLAICSFLMLAGCDSDYAKEKREYKQGRISEACVTRCITAHLQAASMPLESNQKNMSSELYKTISEECHKLWDKKGEAKKGK